MKKYIKNKLDKDYALVNFGGAFLDIIYNMSAESIKIYDVWVKKEDLNLAIEDVLYNHMKKNGVKDPSDDIINYTRMWLTDSEMLEMFTSEILEALYQGDEFREEIQEYADKMFA